MGRSQSLVPDVEIVVSNPVSSSESVTFDYQLSMLPDHASIDVPSTHESAILFLEDVNQYKERQFRTLGGRGWTGFS